jgi:hypothetical protein
MLNYQRGIKDGNRKSPKKELYRWEHPGKQTIPTSDEVTQQHLMLRSLEKSDELVVSCCIPIDGEIMLNMHSPHDPLVCWVKKQHTLG